MSSENTAKQLDRSQPVNCQICQIRLYRTTNPRLVCTNDQCKHENLELESKIIDRFRLTNPAV